MQGDQQSGSTALGRTMSRKLTITVGVIGGGLLSAMLAFGLAIIVLTIPPLPRLLGLAGEFDGLWVFLLPVYALPGGAIGGLVIGGTWKWQNGFRVAMLIVSLPAAAYVFTNAWEPEMSKDPKDVFVSTVVISLCMVLSGAISLKLIATCFAAVERYRIARMRDRNSFGS